MSHGGGGGGGLPNVRYTGMCHRPGSVLVTSKNPEQVLIFNVLLQNRILLSQSGLKRQKCQSESGQMYSFLNLT